MQKEVLHDYCPSALPLVGILAINKNLGGFKVAKLPGRGIEQYIK